MKRLLYLLLAAASVTGSAPITPFDTSDLDGDDDSPGIVDSSHRARHASTAGGLHAEVIVLPLKSDDEELIRRPAGVTGSIIVDRSDSQVAIIRSAGRDQSDARSGMEHLLRAALCDAHTRGDLKVAIDLPMTLGDILHICNANRFIYSRSVQRGGRAMHEFIVDLYTARLHPT